jgi:hypothetical protein
MQYNIILHVFDNLFLFDQNYGDTFPGNRGKVQTSRILNVPNRQVKRRSTPNPNPDV